MPSASPLPHAAVRHTGLRYLLVGASNSALGFAAIWLALRGLDWQPAAANAAGYAVGFLWSYALNRRWTFAHRGDVPASLWRFGIVCALGYAANLAMVLMLSGELGPRSLLAQCGGMIVYTVLTYLGARHWAFPQRRTMQGRTTAAMRAPGPFPGPFPDPFPDPLPRAGEGEHHTGEEEHHAPGRGSAGAGPRASPLPLAGEGLGERATGVRPTRTRAAGLRAIANRLPLLALVAAGATLPWLAPYPAMIDLPQHAGQVAALRDLLAGTSPWRHELRINPFTPYLLGYGAALALSWWMPVTAALKLLLSAAYLAYVGAGIALRRRVGADARLDWLFVPGFFGFAYEWGFLTFLLAVPLGLLFLLPAWRHARAPTLRTGAAIVLGGALLFVAHGLVFLFAGAVGAASVLFAFARHDGSRPTTPAPPTPRSLLFALMPYAVLALLALLYAGHAQRLEATLDYAWPAIEWRWDWMRLPLLLVSPWGAWSAHLPFALATLLMLAAPWAMGLRPRWHLPHAWLPLAAVLLIWLCVPHYAMRTAFLFQRFGILLLPCYALLFAMPAGTAGPTRAMRARWCAVALCAACALHLGWQARRALAFADETRDFDAVLAAAAPGQRALMLIFEAGSKTAAHPGAYQHFPLWYQARRQGLVDFNFAWFLPQIVRYRGGHAPPLGPAEMLDNAFPASFDWHRHGGGRYRYLFVRRATPLPAGFFATAGCRAEPVRSAGPWSLYATRDCPPPAERPLP
ncbi:GtrA family protein [Cupriavidus gilardii]|uniref:GtrA family protein n=1 Tax=Cupriavidus gilardii TaxID=82541 RepID=UPI0009EEA966|nr:GtrA family protein [Cupriavidus gilardii]